jgi:hypothetical protein
MVFASADRYVIVASGTRLKFPPLLAFHLRFLEKAKKGERDRFHNHSCARYDTTTDSKRCAYASP